MRLVLASVFMLTLPGCTGLVAGPETSVATPVPVSRDSAWVRTRRAATAEAITIDIADSANGRIAGTRYSDPKARVGSATSCRVRLALQIQGDDKQSQLATTSRWMAPEQMGDTASKVCDKERTDVLTRITQTVAPTPQ